MITKINELANHDILIAGPEKESQIIRSIRQELQKTKGENTNIDSDTLIDKKRVDDFLITSVKDALTKRSEQDIRINIIERIHHYQTLAFEKNTEWKLLKTNLKERLNDDLNKIINQKYSRISKKETDKIIQKSIRKAHGYFISKRGSKFKSYKKTFNPRAEETLIKTECGSTYKILNRISEKHSHDLFTQFGIRHIEKYRTKQK